MRRVSVFCNLVHAVGTDLHFDPFAVRSHDGHMQGLVSVRLRRRDPVAYPFRVRTIELRDGRIDHPALVFLTHRLVRREDDSNGHQVIDVLKSTLFAHHLLPDRIDGFDTRLEREGITHRGEAFPDRLGKLLETLQLRRLYFLQLIVYLLPGFRMLVFETQVFQFRLDREQA